MFEKQVMQLEKDIKKLRAEYDNESQEIENKVNEEVADFIKKLETNIDSAINDYRNSKKILYDMKLSMKKAQLEALEEKVEDFKLKYSHHEENKNK